MSNSGTKLFHSIKFTLRDSIRRAIPFVITQYEWAIGLYTGKSPLDLVPIEKPENPVLTLKDVTDIEAKFIADPFLVHHGNQFYLFFEAWDGPTAKGVLAFADSPNGLDWTYRQVILAEPFHLSYPHVFFWHGQAYMTPESQTNSVCLYRAEEFPFKWVLETTLIEREALADPTPFYYHDHWWMFVGTVANDTLYLYHADTPLGPWIEHPMSPLLTGEFRYSRPGGRVFSYEGHLYRVGQDGLLRYGHQLHLFEITELTTTTYKEKIVAPSPWLAPGGEAWNSHGMHQMDVLSLENGQYLACVDGYRRLRRFRNNFK